MIHKTLTGLLGMLKLSEKHREHLRKKRGLTDDEIDRLGYKSTPPFYMCKPLTNRLISQGYTVEGVPGFYQKDGPMDRKLLHNACRHTDTCTWC